MSFVPVNPRPMLESLINKRVTVRLKWGTAEYTGKLVAADSYMNLQLAEARELMDRRAAGDLGQVLIRCNNVLWIKAADAGEPDELADNGDGKLHVKVWRKSKNQDGEADAATGDDNNDNDNEDDDDDGGDEKDDDREGDHPNNNSRDADQDTEMKD